MPFKVLLNVLAFLVSTALAIAVVVLNLWAYGFWSRSVMVFPDRWMQVFPTWYGMLFHLAVYGSYFLAATAAGLVVGIAFGRHAWKAALWACLLVAAGHWFLLLVSIYGLISEVENFWIPMACLFCGMLGGLHLGARAAPKNPLHTMLTNKHG
jgi:hypothetical protein